MSWINVKEKIPHYNNLYWVFQSNRTEKEAIRICYYDRKKKRFIDMGAEEFYLLHDIGYWAPIEKDKFSLQREAANL